MSNILLTFEKSEIPIIWLDTSIIIKMTLWKNDEPLDADTAQKMEYLYNTIYQVVSEKKLVCPLADQGEEIWKGRHEILETMLSLSWGIRSKHSEEIKANQMYQFMKAYVNDEKEVSILSNDFFMGDPLEQLTNAPEVIIQADLGLPETAAEIRNRKDRQIVNLKEMRKKCLSAGVTYEDQLTNELNADLETFSIIRYNSLWEKLGSDQGELSEFFKSSHYRSIPLIDISCKLGAKLITGTDEIKLGHPMDVHHAASAIPYVNLFITDRNMKHIISGLDIDEYYQCKVCHIGDWDEIKKFFSDL